MTGTGERSRVWRNPSPPLSTDTAHHHAPSQARNSVAIASCIGGSTTANAHAAFVDGLHVGLLVAAALAAVAVAVLLARRFARRPALSPIAGLQS